MPALIKAAVRQTDTTTAASLTVTSFRLPVAHASSRCPAGTWDHVTRRVDPPQCTSCRRWNRSATRRRRPPTRRPPPTRGASKPLPAETEVAWRTMRARRAARAARGGRSRSVCRRGRSTSGWRTRRRRGGEIDSRSRRRGRPPATVGGVVAGRSHVTRCDHVVPSCSGRRRARSTLTCRGASTFVAVCGVNTRINCSDWRTTNYR